MAKYCRTRANAKKLGRLYYKTGEPCARGHVSHRFTSTGRCVECDKLNKVSRRQAIIQRTPPWADKGEIQKIYDMAFDLGFDWHVDHKIPLQGEFVSGLHVPENLQILPRHVNLQKSNIYEVQ